MKTNQHYIITIIITLFFIISGCASIVSKSVYPISINSNPPGAKISINNKKGNIVYSGQTPSTVNLSAKSGFFNSEKYSVLFTMDNYDLETVPIEFNIDGWYFGNIFLGGLIGMLIVDPATGAMWSPKTNYINLEFIKNRSEINNNNKDSITYSVKTNTKLNSTVKPEFPTRKSLVTLKSGREILCYVKSEDNENYYLTIKNNNKTHDFTISKDKVESVITLNKK
ncbi:MAG: hypothetical protein JW717_13270 [Marinilabiliaceae bacterium]|nr:hypothetical protein [Marinilabiliaceae bacterium]